jgi:hypothetical protein
VRGREKVDLRGSVAGGAGARRMVKSLFFHWLSLADGNKYLPMAF